jgi:hypothetical protein
MRRFLTLTLISTLCALISISNSYGEECQGTTCIDVSADSEHQVVITVKKGTPGSTMTKKPVVAKKRTPRATPSPSHSLWIPWLPKPVDVKTPTPRPSVSRKPRATKAPAVKVSTISASEVMDQVRKLLPLGAIYFQPPSQILVREPVFFRTSVPQRFTTIVVVLDIPIEIDLHARYLWSFGDGVTLVTTDPGASYPLSTVRHSYSQAGNFEVALQVNWSGTWRSGALSAPIRGHINQSFTKQIEVQAARTRLTQ